MCLGTHGAENAEANKEQSFTDTMKSQSAAVFGADNKVFNTMFNAYDAIVNAGPSQKGFSAAQNSEMNAAAITNGANQAKFANARLGNQQAGFGGGGIPTSASGSTSAASAQLNEAIAGQTAGELNKIQQENWAQGNANWKTAGAGLEAAPNAYNDVGKQDSSILQSEKMNMSNAQAADAASNWWVKPAMGAVGAALNMVAPGAGMLVPGQSGGSGGGNFLSNGIGNLSSDSSFGENIGNFFNGGQNGGVGTMPSSAPGAPPDFSGLA